MAIKLPKIFGKFLKIDSSPTIEERVQALVKSEMNKAGPNDVLRFNWAQLPYQDRNIRKNFPLGVSFNVLRDFSNYYPIARACLEWRKAQVTQLSWNITPVELNAETVKSEHNVKRAKELKAFFKYPTGKKSMTFSAWLKQIMEDLLVIDVVAIYRTRNRRGDVTGYLPIDGSTIQLILLEDGTVPDPPAYAYMQKVGIREYAKLTTDELIYDMMNPRTYNPFGRSPLETLIITVTTALKLEAYNLGWLCYDDKTEILTKKGWKHYRDLTENDYVATRSGKGEFEWQKPLGRYSFDYNDDLLHFKTETVDAMVTPNHRMLVNYRNSHGIINKENIIKRADWFLNNPRSTTQNYLVPMTSTWNCSEETLFTLPQYTVYREGRFSGYAFNGRDKNNNPVRNTEKFVTDVKKTQYVKEKITIPIEDWMAFLGIYLAEGWVSQEIRSRHNIYIAQDKKSKHWLEIKELLERLPFTFNWRENRQLFEASDARLWSYLKPLGKSYEKYIDEKIKDFPPRLLNVLWEWMLKGDGSIDKKGKRHYCTTSKKLADDVQELLQKCGRDGYIKVVDQSYSIGKEIKKGKKIKSSRLIYRIYERKGLYRSLLPPKKVHYVGKVYSVKVPNGIVYVRRNGHPIWAGNTEGNVPEGFVSVPRDIASSRDQLKEWQDAWDSMLAGDPRFQRKLKFLPEGMKYDPTIKPSDMNFERFEKWLLQNTCAVYGVPPAAIGFNFETNRSSGQLTFESSKSLTSFTTRQFIKELIDRMIQEDKAYDDLEFTWTNYLSDMSLEEIKVADTAVKSGLMAIDEWRLPRGLTPTGAKDPLIMTPVGPTFVKDLAAQSKSGMMPVLPYKPATPDNNNGNGSNQGNVGSEMAEAGMGNGKSKKTEEVLEEFRKWRKASINDWKAGKKPRDFQSSLIDIKTQMIIKKSLEKVNNKEDIEMIFNPYLSSEYKMSNELLGIYDTINNVIKFRENQVAINA